MFLLKCSNLTHHLQAKGIYAHPGVRGRVRAGDELQKKMKSSHRTHPEAKGHAHKLQLKTDMDMHESKNCREFLDAQKFKSSDTGNKALSSFDDRLLISCA